MSLGNDFRKSILLRAVLILVRLITLKTILAIMSKKSITKAILKVISYIVTLALGLLGGEAGIVS